jgi:predicted nucleotidyltransferase component of viral defense system
MADLKENKSCYFSSTQREVLINLMNNHLISDKFFLTGGTALSVFYLHHRKSEDIDLFSSEYQNLSELDFWISRNWINNIKKRNETSKYLSYLIKDVRVDLAIDELSNNKERYKYIFEEGEYVFIDNAENIVSNKLCVLVSRTEIKDYIDFYYLCKNYSKEKIYDVYKDALLKDSIFEDPPTIGYQIEEGYKFVLKNESFLPELMIEFDMNLFKSFYLNLTRTIYNKEN